MKTIHAVSLLVTFIGAAGCAAAMPPQDLVAARTAYQQAANGQAATLDPADLHSAKETLDLAEVSFAKDGDTLGTRDTAYTAARRSAIAESRARAIAATQQKDNVVDKMHADEKTAVALTSAELGRTKTALATKDVQFQNERQRREDAEKRAAQAAADLAKFATVKQETRGMVITLNGSVLFASAKSDLLPTAQMKLNEVANALIKEDPSSKIVVEGYTDSQGPASYNQDLSQHRAQAVRDYLVLRGIARDRIIAQGFGPTRSIADNNSPEGRANNRRVEIVVQPATP